jgi:hypothetical protein
MITAEQSMSKDARIKLEQRIAEHAATAKTKSSSSYIRPKDGQSFKAIFTGNADERC